MVALPKLASFITPEEYLALEREAETKSEYWNGRIYAMSGACEAHNLISANLVAGLHGQLKKRPCKVYPEVLPCKCIYWQIS